MALQQDERATTLPLIVVFCSSAASFFVFVRPELLNPAILPKNQG
jgi:hypothetical protein